MAEVISVPESGGAAAAQRTETGHAHRHPIHRIHRHGKEEKAKTTGILKYLPFIIAFILYLAVASVMFYPITAHIFTNAPGTGADTYQNLWDIWWVRYAVFNLHTNAFYTNMIFWPIGANLVFQTLAPLNGIIYAPFGALGTVFTYNIMFLVGFALSGLCMYVLAEYLTNNSYAALVSGFIFAFSAFHIAQSYSHIHFINIEWIPLFFYFFLRVMHEEKNYLNIVGMATSFALTTLMGNIEQTLMLLIAFVIILVVYLFYNDTRKRILSIGFAAWIVLFLVLAFVIGSWNFIPLLKTITNPNNVGIANYLNTAVYNIAWSVKPLGFFIPSYANGVIFFAGVPNWVYASAYPITPVENVGYIGYAVLALVAYAIYKHRKGMLPWIIGAVVFAWLSLGPSFGLYSIYHALPFINVIREPGRFDLIFTMFIAIIAAYGVEELIEYVGQMNKSSRNNTMAYALVIVLLAIMFIESNGMPIGKSPYQITKITIPQLYTQIANIPGNFSVLELPTLPLGNNASNLYPGEETFYTSVTHKPLVGGYISRQNVSSSVLIYNIPLTVQTSYLITNGTGYYPSPINENFTNQTLFSLYNYNTEIVTLHKDAFSLQQLQIIESYLAATFGHPVYNDNSVIAFQTFSAINRSIFNSFVAYPILSDWAETSMFVNGSNYNFWIPSGPGAVAVYAPYQAARILNPVQNAGAPSYINTTISFVATSSVPQTLYISGQKSDNSTVRIASLSINSSINEYTVNTVLVSGPLGNELFFTSSNRNTQVLINGITFTRLHR
ncbi:MAG: hypothetical protein ACHQX1_01045 [Candidatus Micrarchaeales archaeon]